MTEDTRSTRHAVIFADATVSPSMGTDETGDTVDSS